MLVPANRRNRCLFAESCSKHVYRITKEKGVGWGIKALKKRYKQCRPGYVLYHLPNGEIEMRLSNGEIVPYLDISPKLLSQG